MIARPTARRGRDDRPCTGRDRVVQHLVHGPRMIGQDAPSADTLLEHSPDGTWSEAGVVQGSTSSRDHSGGAAADGVIPTFDHQEDRTFDN